jgi:hypothetical protein
VHQKRKSSLKKCILGKFSTIFTTELDIKILWNHSHMDNNFRLSPRIMIWQEEHKAMSRTDFMSILGYGQFICTEKEENGH